MTDRVVGSGSPDGPVVLITGASAGIGEACARVFSAEGYRVAGCSNEPDQGKMLAEELNSQGPGSMRFVECDVRDPEQITAFVDVAVNEFGRLDVLINNVGVSCPSKTADQYTLGEIEDLMRVNLFSCILTTGAALPHLRRTRGSIVNIGSVSASLGHDQVSLYCATKGAIAAFSKAVAIDEVHSGVRVNTVLPGNIMTSSRQRLEDSIADPTEMHDFIESWQWMGRSGAPEEVANTCFFLASDKASYITGTEVLVTGGSEIGFGPKQRTTVRDGHVIRIPVGGSVDGP